MPSNALPGSAKQWDHTCLCHAIWKHLLFLGAEAHIMRVPTDKNLADLPSRSAPQEACEKCSVSLHARECYQLLEALGMLRVKPILHDAYMEAQTWEHLSLRFECSPGAAADEVVEVD